MQDEDVAPVTESRTRRLFKSVIVMTIIWSVLVAIKTAVNEEVNDIVNLDIHFSVSSPPSESDSPKSSDPHQSSTISKHATPSPSSSHHQQQKKDQNNLKKTSSRPATSNLRPPDAGETVYNTKTNSSSSINAIMKHYKEICAVNDPSIELNHPLPKLFISDLYKAPTHIRLSVTACPSEIMVHFTVIQKLPAGITEDTSERAVSDTDIVPDTPFVVIHGKDLGNASSPARYSYALRVGRVHYHETNEIWHFFAAVLTNFDFTRLRKHIMDEAIENKNVKQKKKSRKCPRYKSRTWS